MISSDDAPENSPRPGDVPGQTAGTEASRVSATLPLAEEVVQVTKREVVTGRVRVRTSVETQEKLVRQDLDTSHVSVTRVPINRMVDQPPVLRTDGDVTVIPVVEEVLVVETRLLLKEEIHIRRTLTKETVEERVPLRKQRAIIEEVDGDGDGG